MDNDGWVDEQTLGDGWVDETVIEDNAEESQSGLSLIQGEAPSFSDKAIDRLFSVFQDPQKEKAKAVQALVDSEIFKVSPGTAYRYRDAIDEGVKLNPAAVKASERTNALDRVMQSFDIGKKQNVLGEMGFKYILSGDPKWFDEMSKVGMPTENETFIPESRLEKAISEAAKMFPMMFDSAKEGISKGFGVGMVAGGTVALMGGEGPQGLVTIPSATALGFTVGSVEGAFESALRKEAGLALSEIMQFKDEKGNQIDPNLARATAFGIGTINGGIEVAQLKLLLKTIPGLDKYLSKAIIDTVSSKSVKEKLAVLAGKYAGTVAKETAQEVAQESTNIVFEELAKQINNATKGTDIKPATVNEVFDRLYETASSSAQAFSVMALPGNVVKAGKEVMPERKKKEVKQTPATTQQAEIILSDENQERKRSNQPFIIGVNDDNGEVTGFTMADPISGNTFDVPAINKTKDIEGATLSYIPDPQAINTELGKVREPEEIDTKIDALIQGDEDIEAVGNQLFGDDVSSFEEEAKSKQPLSDIEEAKIIGSEIHDRFMDKYSQNPDEIMKGKTELQIFDKEGNVVDLETFSLDVSHMVEDIYPKWKNKGSAFGKEILAEKMRALELIRGYDLPQKMYDDLENSISSMMSQNIREKITGNKAQEAKGTQLKRAREADIDNKLDQIIQSDIDAESAADEMLGRDKVTVGEEDVQVFEPAGEKGSIDPAEEIRRGKEIINEMINTQSDHPDAMRRDDVGSIEFPWGKEGNPNKQYAGGYGVAHIIAKHGVAVVQKVVEVIAEGKITRVSGPEKGKRINIGHEGHTAVLSLYKEGNRETWLLTGWKNKTSDGLGEVNGPAEPTHAGPMRTRSDMVAEVNNSISQNDSLVNKAKAINETLGDKGYVDLAPIVELGRHILAEGKQTYESFSGRFKELLQNSWGLLKEIIKQAWNILNNERGSISNRDAANADPLFDVIEYIKQKFGGLNYDSLRKDWSAEDLADLMKRRPGVVTKDGTGKLDEVAQEFDMDDNKLMMDLLSRKSKKAFMSKTSNRREAEYLKEIYDNEKVSRLEFTKAINEARKAFKEGNAVEVKRLKNSIKWMAKRKATLKNVRDYFGLTDNDMMKISKKNPLLMDEQEFAQYLKDVNLKAIDLRDTKWAKIELMNLIEEKRLQKVDNYRKALELPPISEMTTDQLRQFAKLLEPFENDDVFLTQRELETVDKTDLKGIRTWREARERLAREAGVELADLSNVKVGQLDSFRWDSALREKDPFFDLLVTKMTESIMGAEMKVHNTETFVYDLAKKSEKSRERGLVERAIPQDELIFKYLESPQAEKNAVAQQMTPEQIRLAHFMNQYFSNALDYLIAIKSVERGRDNYITHIRKSFLENMRDKGIKEAITGIFTAYQEDQIGFNILDDNTGNILPLEKFFQFSLHRTGEMEPTKNVVKAFMTYVRMFEKKKAFDAIIPKLDIYTQSLTPTRYTPRGLEFDRSLKQFVNKWINNKKGRKISYDSVIRQGGPLDLGIMALRTFTSIVDLGFYVPAQIINFMGEQLTTLVPLGVTDYAKSIALMRTDKGKRILKKYEFFTDRSLWEEFTAPGKEVTDRLMDGMFGFFHISTVAANKQFLLASMTKEEYENEELSPERLAVLKLDMGRFRAIPGTNSLIGSTSAGSSLMQYKAWAAAPTRTLIKDITVMVNKLSKKKYGEAFTLEEAREIYRIVGLTTAMVMLTSLAGADDDDDTFIGKMKWRAKREVFTLTQGMNPAFWLSWRTRSFLKQLAPALTDIVTLEEYKTKEGYKGVDQLLKTVTPGMVRALPDREDDK